MEDTHKFGGKIIAIIAFIIGFIAFQLLFYLIIKPNNATPEIITTECKADSLQNIIDSLQIDIKISEDEFDLKERRYEDIIGEYEIGLSYLQDYHPSAYKDFHRIIGMKEQYSRELDKENKQRLKYQIKL